MGYYGIHIDSALTCVLPIRAYQSGSHVPNLGRETPMILADLLGMRVLLPKWAAADRIAERLQSR